jgi:sortase B
MARKLNISTKIAAFMAAILLLIAASGFLLLYSAKDHATNTPPIGNVSDSIAVNIDSEDDEFAQVNWGYWQSINPDIVAWIVIPGTNINAPVVYASKEDPNFYLTHDIYKNWNPYGAIYLDADCSEDITNNPNSIIYGHHMSDGTMFAAISNYANKNWSTEHLIAYLQTPTSKIKLVFKCANIIDASSETITTAFNSSETYANWIQNTQSKSSNISSELDTNKPTITLCTCSYTTFKNERALAYFQQTN